MVVVGVSPVGAGSEGAKPSRLYITRDLEHWRDVTPPQSQAPDASFQVYQVFEQASFINPSTGWVTAWNNTSFAVTVYRTSDGGKTWTTTGGLSHGMHAGAALLIDLITPTTAFAENIDPAGPETALMVTRNSGQTWKTVYTGPPPPATEGGPLAGPDEMPFTFINALDGFSSLGFPPQAAFPTAGVGDFFYTVDGGSTWKRQSPPLPMSDLACPTKTNSESSVSCEYSVPIFNNVAEGVLVSAVTSNLTGELAFDVTIDGGHHWSKRSERTVQARTYPSPVPDVGPSVGFPLVAIASPTTWWTLSWDKSTVTVDVTTNQGATWTQTSAPIPPGNPAVLAATNSNHALLAVNTVTTDGTTTTGLLATSDSGHRWKPVNLGR
jgi:photosystem II stability/assembly factor-like uncharacterized protein